MIAITSRNEKKNAESWQIIAKQAATESFEKLLVAAKQCNHCVPDIILENFPVFEVSAEHSPQIIIASQAPGRIAHQTRLTFNDPSGDRLRDWMGISKDIFYDTRKIAIVPMGFCYPGKGKSGDLPPIKACQEIWHPHFFQYLTSAQLIISVGAYSQNYHLRGQQKRTLTDTVRAFEDYLEPENPSLPIPVLPIPHPSPRNNIWLRKNPWFEDDVIPRLKALVAAYTA